MFIKTKTDEERLLEKVVVEGDCWIWQATTNGDGYGRFRFEGKLRSAHRVSYVLYKGEIPKELCVLHRCDTPACINPDHLFLGTQTDNVHDMENKGRSVHPSNNRSKEKVTPEAYKEICRLRGLNYSQSKIAKVVGISQAYVSRLLRYGYDQKFSNLLSSGKGIARKIDRETCFEMVNLRGQGMTYEAIGSRFEVSTTTAVRLIKHGYDYKQPRKKLDKVV